MARPRSVTDDDILHAVARVIGRQGPVAFTLRDVGDEVGLAAPTLLQRFGNKQGLLLALAQRGAHSVDAWFDEARAAHASPLDAIVAALVQGARQLERPDEVAHHVAFPGMDAQDPALRIHTQSSCDTMRRRIRALLTEAVLAKELAPCDVHAVAGAIEACYHGSLVAWGVRRKGRAQDALEANLRALLQPRHTG